MTSITQATPKGALFYNYDWCFHKMVGRLRRLDGTYKVPDGEKAIDPVAADKVSKFYIACSASPMYGHFFGPCDGCCLAAPSGQSTIRGQRKGSGTLC